MKLIYLLVIFVTVLSNLASAEFKSHDVEKASEIGDHGKNFKMKLDSEIDEVTYVAAVLEYEPNNTWSDIEGGAQALRVNAMAFSDYAVEAKTEGADIMITPEYGLQSLDMHTDVVEEMITYSQYIPHPLDKVAPHTLNVTALNNIEALAILSEAALSNQIYMVIDMSEVEACSDITIPLSAFEVDPSPDCPESGYFFYNTQVVFDRSGIVIARYRKQNLYLEAFFTQGPLDDDFALFETDFDVAFSLNICFDLVYEHPAYSNVLHYGIRDVAMSTAWVDVLPYGLANMDHNSGARGWGINLMVSGHHRPPLGKVGSGIYRWYNNNDLPVYVFDKDSGNVLKVATVTTISKSSLFTGPKGASLKEKLRGTKNSKKDKYKNRVTEHSSIKHDVGNKLHLDIDVPIDNYHTILHSNLSDFTAAVLPKTRADSSNTMMKCDGSFCCTVTYTHSGTGTYMLLVENGALYLYNYRIGAQICSVVWCRTEDKDSCANPIPNIPSPLDHFGPFTLSAIFEDSDRMVVLPQGVDGDYQLLDSDDFSFNADVTGNSYSLHSDHGFNNTLVLALFGRWYSNDEEPTMDLY